MPAATGQAAISAYPLSWPVTWKRTPPGGRRAWPTRMGVTIASARDRLLLELDRLGATDVVISTDMPVRMDGVLRASAGEPADPGVALYFDLQRRPTVLACDAWSHVSGNLRALARHVEALRGIERWGVGTIEQAFGGYAALPPIGGTTIVWSEVLGVAPTASAEEIRAAYARAVKVAHPDHGGSVERLQRVVQAWDEVRRAGLVA